MENEADSRHKGGTQPEDLMYLNRKPNGNYQVRRRIPTEIQKSGILGKKKDLKRSLKTKDRTVALRRLAPVLAEFQEILDNAQQELEQSGRTKQVAILTTTRSLSLLTDRERNELVIKEFVNREKEAIARGDRETPHIQDENRQDIIETFGTDLAVLEGTSTAYQPLDWESEALQMLSRNGLTVDENSRKAFREICNYYKRGIIETAFRTLQAKEGEAPHSTRDRLFADFAGTLSDFEAVEQVSYTVGDACREFLETRVNQGRAASTIKKYSQQTEVMREFWGCDFSLACLDVVQAKKFVTFLAAIPVNAKKSKAFSSLTKAAEAEGKKKDPKTIGAKTQRDYFNGISSVLNLAVENEMMRTNPLTKQTVTCLLPPVEDRAIQMFSGEELLLLFKHVEFTSQRGKFENKKRAEAKFWVPLLCLFHGVRVNEVCQLLTSDIKEEEGIPYLHIHLHDEGSVKVKSLKTKASLRKIPIHDKLLEIGFLSFVEAQTADECICLFPELTANTNGSKSSKVSKWFIRTLRGKALPDLEVATLGNGDKTLKSMRHLFARKIRDAGVPSEIRFALGGWTRKERQNAESGYGKGYSLPVLKEALDRLDYSAIDFSILLNQTVQ